MLWFGRRDLAWGKGALRAASCDEGRELLAEGRAPPKVWAILLGSVLFWEWTGPGQGPWALLELTSGDYGKTQSPKVGERSWSLGTPDFGLCPLRLEKHKTCEITVFPPLPLACPAVIGP